jgi:Transposase
MTSAWWMSPAACWAGDAFPRAWRGCGASTSWSPNTPTSRRWCWWASRPTVDCWSRAWSRPAIRVYAINPFAVSRYRDRHTTSGAKSDPGDAKVLADLVRTDAHNHRPVAGDSELVEAIKVVARAHQSLTWSRQRFVNQLRSTLREFYPAALEAFGTDLAGRDAVALLERAPTPAEGRTLSLSRIRATLERAGRQRNLDARAAEIQQALRSPQLQPSPCSPGHTAAR